MHMYSSLTCLHSSHPTSVFESKFKGKKEKEKSNQNRMIPSPFLLETKVCYTPNCTISNAW